MNTIRLEKIEDIIGGTTCEIVKIPGQGLIHPRGYLTVLVKRRIQSQSVANEIMENKYKPVTEMQVRGEGAKGNLTLTYVSDFSTVDFDDCLEVSNFADSDQNLLKITYKDKEYKSHDVLRAKVKVTNPYGEWVPVEVKDKYPGARLLNLTSGLAAKQSFEFVFDV